MRRPPDEQDALYVRDVLYKCVCLLCFNVQTHVRVFMIILVTQMTACYS